MAAEYGAGLDFDEAIRIGLCCRYYPGGPAAGCGRRREHAGQCGPAEVDPAARCRRRCPEGECSCPLPGDPAINVTCGDSRAEQCRNCGGCRVCDGCYCGEG